MFDSACIQFVFAFRMISLYTDTSAINDNYGLSRWLSGKESSCPCRRCRWLRFNLWVREIPWRRKWQPTPVFLPGKSHWQRSLVGHSPWGHKELDMTYWLSSHDPLSTSVDPPNNTGGAGLQLWLFAWSICMHKQWSSEVKCADFWCQKSGNGYKHRLN